MGWQSQNRGRGKRVLALVSDAFGGYGGIAAYNRDFLSALCADELIAEVVALPRAASSPIGDLPDKLRFDISGTGGALRYARAALRTAIGGGFDVVFCGHLNMAALGWLTAKAARAPWIVQIHGIEAWTPHPKPLVRRAVMRADRVFSVSEVSRDRFLGWSGFARERTRQTPLAIDASKFGLAPRNEALARRLGVAGRTTILTFGRLSSGEQYKGFDEILELLPELARTHPDIVYIIAGKGEDSLRLERKAADLGVADRVRFTGMVDEAEKADLYRLADVYAMPSRGEGFGFVMLEAMACGVPVVASAVDGGREAVRDGAIGMIVDPGDRKAIRAAIEASLALPRAVPEGLDFFTHANFNRCVQDVVLGTMTS